jgi:succinyl-CoA synthetase beta subunit
MMELLDYFDGKRLLDKHGIKSVESRYVSSAQDAVAFAAASPIVLKLISGKALHKSKAGLVKLDLKGPDISKAYSELVSKGRLLKPYRIIAQKMAKNGVEIIIGGRTDEQFGKLILIGLGGIYVNIFKDFALRVCPIKQEDAQEMIDQLKSRDIVTFGGKNRKILVKLLMDVNSLLVENRSISELDLNPVVARADGYVAVDIRMLMQ